MPSFIKGSCSSATQRAQKSLSVVHLQSRILLPHLELVLEPFSVHSRLVLGHYYLGYIYVTFEALICLNKVFFLFFFAIL